MILKQTQILKQQIGSLDSVEERLKLLKNKYKNKTACILAPGPSLRSHELDALHKTLDRDDLVVLSIKQAYDFAETNTDFHILNTWNFDKVNGYNYNEDTIVFFGLSKSYVEAQMEKIAVKPSVCDIWIPITNPPFINETQTIQALRNYDVFWDLDTKMEIPWGKSIFYEQAIPLALHLGCRDIVTIGWDIGNPKLGANQGHSYSYDKIKPIPADPTDIQEAIDSTKELHEWFGRHDINFRILSNTNPADIQIKRIPNLESI